MTPPMVDKTYRFDVGWLRVRFTFVSPSQGSFVVEEGGGLTPNGHAETVALDLKEIRDNVYLNSWGEACGTTVTHVVDYANATVYANVTVDGTLYNFVGTFAEVTDVPIADRRTVGSGPAQITSPSERTTAMNDQDQREVTVRDNPDESRFDVFVEDTHAGLSAYKDLGETQRVFYHTVVFDEFGGRGLAGALTRTALSTTIQAGHRIVAVCPYVKKWLATHHDFDDATDPVGREHLRALR